ncbi:putative bifunctional diguanylate cyclase/phosphodiesterase [Pararhizobium polonicum]|uniref:putative bifunctional diguanylate cyclase/phosphodiesterase n=1 Tax=Pararhizobium polonicum TaxID=1612624 RepID=UPI0013146F0B|nr:bifunctional diguanylate cyclase/phosphodiesterase [Pararhizobium polonicum]
MSDGVHGLWGSGTPTFASLSVVLMPLICGVLFYQGGRARSRLMQELELRRKTEEDLSRALHTDQLTGIANRFALECDLRERLSATGPVPAARTALLMLDLDRFKFVNDSMGHDAGDELLIALAQRLIQAMSGFATVYRLGGDEFVIVVAGAPSDGKLDDICATIKSLLAEPFQLSSAQFWTGGSIGVAYIEPDDRSMSAVLKRADLALYKAKEIAGNSHMVYEPDMAEEATRKGEIEYDLSRALAAGEFFLEYQPIVGIESRAIRSFEALIRWRHPEKGVIPPDRFISAAEKTGLILPIGNWVLRTACLEAARWPAPTGIAVNVAGDQFKDRAFVPHVKACLAEAGLAPGRLTIEVTESIFHIDAAIISDSLMELRAHGVRIALDDFGIGFSSINNLRRFPLDQLKVDRSFTKSMLGNQRDAEIVDIILQLGNTFQVSTTIEGIETEGQMEFVRALGASEAQGFLISRPVSAEDAFAILQREPEKLAVRSAG